MLLQWVNQFCETLLPPQQRDLASTAETLRQQLAVAQQQLESRQALLQQLTAPSHQGKLGAPSTSSTPRSVKWAPDANGSEGVYDARSSAPTSPMRVGSSMSSSICSLGPDYPFVTPAPPSTLLPWRHRAKWCHLFLCAHLFRCCCGHRELMFSIPLSQWRPAAPLHRRGYRRT